mmetsp:Transcript_25634/g.75677  ORF Transcript_25634/g.75677 Transcript_25634/m.75677 type:complete len:209 (-) Transcript_25634:761-1387(-)
MIPAECSLAPSCCHEKSLTKIHQRKTNRLKIHPPEDHGPLTPPGSGTSSSTGANPAEDSSPTEATSALSRAPDAPLPQNLRLESRPLPPPPPLLSPSSPSSRRRRRRLRPCRTSKDSSLCICLRAPRPISGSSRELRPCSSSSSRRVPPERPLPYRRRASGSKFPFRSLRPGSDSSLHLSHRLALSTAQPSLSSSLSFPPASSSSPSR